VTKPNHKIIQMLAQQLPGNRLAELQSDQLLIIGQLQEAVGIDPSAVRYYEREGLIHPNRLGHMRSFSPTEVERLAAIRQLRNLKFSISTILSMLDTLEKSEDENENVIVELLASHSKLLQQEDEALHGHIGHLNSMLDQLQHRG
jgi:DNA-binding transcriptional MerR regulator